MKHRIFTRIAIALFITPLLASPVAAQEWGDKMFDRLQIKFGSVARLADTTFKVKITNPYVEEIRISSLTTSCGCISWSDQVPISIPSRAERELTIRLDTVRHVGDKRVKAIVTLLEPIKGLTATITLPVEGRIRNDFEVRPSSVGFGAVDLGQGYTQRINITYNGRHDWKIESAKVGSVYFAPQIVEQRRAAGIVQYEIVVELKPDAPAGLLRDQLILTTNEVENPEVSIPIEARVESDIVVTEAQFGTVALGHPKSITIILRGKKPFQIDKVEHLAREVAVKATSDVALPNPAPIRSEIQTTAAREAFKIDFPKTIAPIQMLTLTFMPPEESGMFEESFAVTINGRTKTVTFQAKGRVLDPAVTNAAR